MNLDKPMRYYWNMNSRSFVLTKPESTESRKLFFPPIEGEWLLKAAALPGKALATACVIQLEAAFIRKQTVNLGNKWLSKAGVNRSAKARALQELENVGLIRIERHGNRGPTVTILGRGRLSGGTGR